jgi:L-serine dehydratase
MSISVFDLFSVGIGPSSSHTVGPMRAAHMFTSALVESGQLAAVDEIHVDLYGSLGATGHGHGSEGAVILGLLGETPELVDPVAGAHRVQRVKDERQLPIRGLKAIRFDTTEQLVMHRDGKTLPAHPNGMRFRAASAKETILEKLFYSVGGGFVVRAQADGSITVDENQVALAYPFRTGDELLQLTCDRTIAEVMLANERAWQPDHETHSRLLRIWSEMRACVHRGVTSQADRLPGALKVPRRAPQLYRQLLQDPPDEHLRAMDWITLFALAVNEENAGGGRVVTAPTNGAAGIIPAVLHYIDRYVAPGDDEAIVEFLLTAGAIGIILKQNASISGAEVGCQGEVGSACAMAAAGLAAVLGGSPRQIENAAEIGLEHNLGLTCDPVGGLVQIPCIERNAIAAVKAVTAARTALRGDGTHIVSLDKVVKTMRETGADMSVKYKETSRGGLAVNVIEC